jgi:hypothetical protein
MCVAAVLAGCDASTEPRDSAPRLPRYWQGSIKGPQPETWATGDRWAYPSTVTNASRAVADVPSITPARTPSAATPSPKESVSPEPLDSTAPPATSAASQVAGELLAPQTIAESLAPAPGDVVIVDELPALMPPSPAAIAGVEAAMRFPPETPTAATTNKRTPAKTAPQGTGTPTGLVVSERAQAKIRRGHELAERGAYFAARNQFVDVLRMIAEAKDQLHGAPRRTIALAEGLRALDEAADFAPAAGGAADLKMSVVVASHGTPAAKSLAADEMLPQQLADAYFEFAKRQLGAAVAGEPAGSMALHALGKLQSRLGRVEPENNPQADARSFAFQQAALLSRPDNHMAAHELGVLLAESGHYVESETLLRQVVMRAPHPVVYRNLARVERQMGRPEIASAMEQRAALLASQGAGGNPNVQWVPVNAFVGTPDALGPPATTPYMAARPAAGYAPTTGVPMTARTTGAVQR